MLFEPSAVTAFIQAVVTGFSVLGGFMAAESGLEAVRAQLRGVDRSRLGDEINQGIARGFVYGALCGIPAFIMTLMAL